MEFILKKMISGRTLILIAIGCGARSDAQERKLATKYIYNYITTALSVF